MTTPDRIYVRSVRFDGPSGAGGAVGFDRGLNVVVGPSDTGKSLLLECIDFALGRSSKVKAVPELRPFRSVSVALDLESGGSIELTRNLAGGAILVTSDGQTEKYAQKHDDANDRNVGG